MKLAITAVEVVDGEVVVEATTPIGTVRGRWFGPAAAPGDMRFVELDIAAEDVLSVESARGAPMLECVAQGARIRGVVENVDPESIVMLRLHTSLVIFGAERWPRELDAGRVVEIIVRAMSLHDTNL